MSSVGACTGDAATERLADAYDKAYDKAYNRRGRKPVGLMRHAKQCFMNAVVQCLESSSALCAELGRSDVPYAQDFITLTQREEATTADVLLSGLNRAEQEDANTFLARFVERSKAKAISAEGRWWWTCGVCRNRMIIECADMLSVSVFVHIGIAGSLQHLLTSDPSVQTCLTCNRPTDGTAERMLDKQSPVMAVTLDRTAAGGSRGYTKNARVFKAEERVHIGGDMYELFALVSHKGGASDTDPNSGHYYAHVRRGDKWWRINDEDVQEASLDTADATLLFYRLHPVFAHGGEMSLLRA